jgi:DNA-damage-inducible protein J
MANKTANINVRIDPETKSKAEKLFNSFGITVSDAINIFLKKSIMEGGLPFEVKQPQFNQETENAIHETKNIINGKASGKSYTSAHELFQELDQEMEDN